MEIQFDSNGGSDMVTKASAVDHWIQQVKTGYSPKGESAK
jgi:hypothetical protein